MLNDDMHHLPNANRMQFKELTECASASLLRYAEVGLTCATHHLLANGFFAFAATPKFRTKAVFDEPGPTGASPFHEYSMRQAIEEGFILDVLKNYTTYKRFFGLIKQVEDDPEVPRLAARRWHLQCRPY